MARHLIGRLLSMLAALWAVITGTFLAMHAIPGDPFTDPRIPDTVRLNLMARYGLDLPLWRQYGIYWSNLLRGRLGSSLVDTHRTVGGMIAQGFPVSAALGAESLLWAVTLGAILGLLAAFHRHRVWDYAAVGLAVAGLSVPNFVVGVVLDYLLAVRLRILPVAGWGSLGQTLLPSFSLGLASLALVARLLRAQGAEVLGAEYIRTARAKGLPWSRILWRHVLPNAVLPVLTVLGPLAASVLTGSFVVEEIFSLPGLGSYYVSSVLDRDYPLILGITIFYAALLLVFNFLVDLAYTLVDPRIALGQEGR